MFTVGNATASPHFKVDSGGETTGALLLFFPQNTPQIESPV
jgi:hypothetical protein